MADIELFSAELCPFAHRTRLTLAEKGIEARLREIDLTNKPADFLRLSPFGKVPLLRHGERRIWESAIINEYIDDTFVDFPLLPKHPGQRAQARMWIHFADSRLFATTGRLLYGSPPAQHDALRAQLADELRFLEREALGTRSHDGPYWLGRQFSLVDVTLYPWFEQLAVLEEFRGFALPAELPLLRVWWKAVAERPSVRSLAQPPAYYVERYGRRFAAAGLA